MSSSRPAGRIHLPGRLHLIGFWYTSYFSPRIGHFCHYAQSPCAVFPASVLITSKCTGVKFSLFKGQIILVISYHFWVWPFWIKLCLCNQRALYFELHIKIHISAKIPQSPSLWNKALSQQNGERKLHVPLPGATMISCFFDLILRKVRSFWGSMSLTVLLAFMVSWWRRPAYWTVVELSRVVRIGMPVEDLIWGYFFPVVKAAYMYSAKPTGSHSSLQKAERQMAAVTSWHRFYVVTICPVIFVSVWTFKYSWVRWCLQVRLWLPIL